MITPEGYDTSQIYCLFCVTGKEREVEELRP
jgi:hypothetical protein